MSASTTTPWLAPALAFVLGCSSGTDITEEPPEGYTEGGEEARKPTEAEMLERAKHHPNAQPEQRPLYPEKSPPPLPTRGPPETAPPPQSQTAPLTAPPEAPAATAVAPTTVTAPSEPPAPRYEERPPQPAVTYVWAPGYWYWYDSHYVWIAGAWLPPRPGYTYVGARWVYADGHWLFVSGGWASFGTTVVIHPLHRHRYLYRPRHHHRPYTAPRHHRPGGRIRGGGVRGPRRSSGRPSRGGTTTVRARRR